MTAATQRVRVRVEGVVQGVGFRPYVHRLAVELGLNGFVRNDARGAVIEVEGPAEAIDALLARLPAEAPPAAVIEAVEREAVPPRGEQGFGIVESARAGTPDAQVSPDIATCEACLRELFDPADRRHRYPFINCTDCGPRFTIVRGVPYDRPLTTMAGFTMCEACAAEYADPSNRRFHAQPNACPACGPTLHLAVRGSDPLTRDPGRGRRSSGAREVRGSDPLSAAAAVLREGGIVAVKGIGGFHLACLAGHEEAVARLRSRKHREEKPFALMAPDLEAARELVELGPVETALLVGRDRPIVLSRRRRDARVAPAVAPRSAELGVMLPYSPLHHLLLADVGEPLVMTSGNVSDEPIAYTDDDALERLAPIADLVLLHDRPIQTRVDDSVLRVAAGRPLPLRRSRGAVPSLLALPMPATRHVLACGAELKSTFCLARGRRAWVSHHIGDLKTAETLASFQEGVRHFERLFAVTPEIVAHDLHPDYLSTTYALAREGVEHVAVQHHHAHLAACLAEHGEPGPAVGAIFDGTGLGTDGTVWGGEVLVGDLRGFERAGHLWPVPLPGGDQAVREPWRMACAWLKAAGDERPLDAIDSERWRAVGRLVETGLAAPVTTSVGRLFDAMSALCGLRTEVTYEGQAAMELEAACDPSERGAYEFDVVAGVLDARPTILDARRDLTRGLDVGVVATRFHHALADATADDCARLAGDRGLDTVVLSGGAFQNRRLLERTASRLSAAGLRVLVPARLPPNDGGIAFGQAAVAIALAQE
jgi:hydrogenase maturation protein HypF